MTTIEWTDETWNPTRGCSRVDDDGCKNCYAMRFAHRFSGPGQRYEGLTRIGKRGVDWAGHAKLVPEQLAVPLNWRKPRRIFVDSMSDLFHESLPFEHIAAVFGVMNAAMHHTFQVLTKRPQRVLEFVNWLAGHGGLGPYIRGHANELRGFYASGLRTETYRGRTGRSSADPWAQVFNAAAVWSAAPLPNVWLGVSVSNQKNADERIPLLLQCPAAIRFVSYEPALGPVNFEPWLRGTTTVHMCADIEGMLRNKSYFGCVRDESGRTVSGNEAKRELEHLLASGVKVLQVGECDDFDDQKGCRGHRKPRIDWVIVGGESGNGARPFEVAWARSTIEQCKAAGVACFVKQLGAHPWVPKGEPLLDRWGALVDPVDDLHTGPSELLLEARKGGDSSEWPEELRVREFPEVRAYG